MLNIIVNRQHQALAVLSGLIINLALRQLDTLAVLLIFDPAVCTAKLLVIESLKPSYSIPLFVQITN
ncbi:hypothetical protein D3C80_2095000 [compost metagenome]